MSRYSLTATVLGIALMTATGAQADEVIASAHDHTAGKFSGALTGLMLGGAVGGPVGVVVGAGLGWFAGWGVQETTGLSGRAYKVRNDEGVIKTVRSPNKTFAIGDQVEQRAGRLYARDTDHISAK